MIEWVDIADEDAFARLVLHASTPVVVAFETVDCDHCRQQRTLLALAWRQLGWTAPTLRVDANRLPQLAERHRIAGYPTITVFADGQLVDRFPGRRDPQTLTRRLGRLFDTHGRTVAAVDVPAEPDDRPPTTHRRLARLLSESGEHPQPAPPTGPLIVRMEPSAVLDDDTALRGAGAQDGCGCAACACPA